MTETAGRRTLTLRPPADIRIPHETPASPFTRQRLEQGRGHDASGETGQAKWRMFEYSPGYLADHWRACGHGAYVLEGELDSELREGRKFKLTAGMSYQVSDFGDAAHRSSTATGATLFIVD